MPKVCTDIDIDVFDRDIVLSKIPHVVARIDREEGFDKHNTGVYFQAIDHDVESNIANIDHKDAEQLGFFKIDFLNVSIYEGVKNEAHIQELLETEPLWELLEHKEFVEKLFHIGKYSDLLKKLKPKTIEELAAVLAIIRPSKRYLQDRDWRTIWEEVWIKPENGDYYFKKSHAIAYSAAIVIQMNLICESIDALY